MEISERQRNILMAIIEEFMNSAEEVGSTYLLQRHNLGVSSATVRSEMVHLMDGGFLEKSHVSSGRLPTDQALRLYVRGIINETKLPPIDDIEIRQGIFRVRFSQGQLVKQLLELLVSKCETAAFYLTNDDRRYYGVSSLMKYGELRDVEALQRILDVLEDENLLRRVFSKYESSGISVLIGSESGIKDLEDCSIVFSPVSVWRNQIGHMGVIGTRRMNYSRVIPVISTVKDSIESSLRGWN